MNIRSTGFAEGTLLAELPCSFEYRVNHRMRYTPSGDNLVVTRKDAETADPSFKLTELWLSIHNTFQHFPEHDTIVMEPT
jgi:hypothetical protein